MATGTEIIVLAGTVSTGILIVSITRGMKMRADGRPLAELLWYAIGLLPLASVCLISASMGDQPVTPQRIILFFVGPAIGRLGFLAAGEWIRPVQAVAPTTQPGLAD